MQPHTLTQVEGLHLLMLSWPEIVVQQVCLNHTLQTPQMALVLQNILLAYCFWGWIFTRVLYFPLQLLPVLSEVGHEQDNPWVCGKKLFFTVSPHQLCWKRSLKSNPTIHQALRRPPPKYVPEYHIHTSLNCLQGW